MPSFSHGTAVTAVFLFLLDKDLDEDLRSQSPFTNQCNCQLFFGILDFAYHTHGYKYKQDGTGSGDLQSISVVIAQLLHFSSPSFKQQVQGSMFYAGGSTSFS